MTEAKALASFFKRNQYLITMQAKDVTTEESLSLPPAGGNCMNWVIGHIVVHRDIALRSLGETPVLDERETEIYKRESEPLTNPEQALPLTTLVERLESSYQRLRDALMRSTPETLAHQPDPADKRTVGEGLRLLQWHETYHAGQLELLRHMAGKHEKLI
ncbi:hypothetical protein KSC_083620 [Ktedonobacter sp. SOSP1-52]|uniref:DinB family protein n=1 Tax=Ktedonobacter sp. SOSP1-52 TaxID=2778366 RepID=UPI0019156F8D|nr:DinB family protein [Ktedonobacter sp. SOSP1-52]GHO69470.1 hypothetical protein KSC_083620 [Ktedonobacter sp. SOSP1-52]